MSRARHHAKRAAGGLTSKPQWNAGGTQNAAKEAEELRKGGKVHHHGEGEESKKRHDRPKRARGGRMRGKGAGADMSPLTTASKVKAVTPGETPEEGVPSD